MFLEGQQTVTGTNVWRQLVGTATWNTRLPFSLCVPRTTNEDCVLTDTRPKNRGQVRRLGCGLGLEDQCCQSELDPLTYRKPVGGISTVDGWHCRPDRVTHGVAAMSASNQQCIRSFTDAVHVTSIWRTSRPSANASIRLVRKFSPVTVWRRNLSEEHEDNA